jgi:Ribosomal protein L7/L12 C-terminal domain
LSATLAIVLLGTRLNKIESKISMLSRVDAKLDLLLKQSGLEYDPYKNLPPSVVDAVQRGKKIEAIKRYRETTGVGLKEAKEFIEDVQRRGGVS